MSRDKGNWKWKLYEIICLCSVNIEANECMFNSVKVVADQCTNRHPDNVVMKVLLHGSEGSLKNQDNRVSNESNFLPCYKGTVIPDNYIESRKSSFQAHLEKISYFLIPDLVYGGRKAMVQLCSEMVIRTFVLENRGHLYDTSAAIAEVWNELLKIGIALSLCDKDILVFNTSGNFHWLPKCYEFKC